MKKKTLHTIFCLSMVVGFVIILGTAGSSDLGMIDDKAIVIRGAIGLACMVVGYCGAKLSGANYLY